MGPRRQPKPDPKAEATSEPLKATPQTQKSSTLNSVPSAKLPQSDSANTAAEGANSAQSGKPWYGGTWPRKATPVTQVAKESISAAGGAASEAVTSARAHASQLPTTPLKSPTVYLSRKASSSTRSLPSVATTTNLNITSNPQSPSSNRPLEELSAKHNAAARPKPSRKNDSAAEGAKAASSDQHRPIESKLEAQVDDHPSEGTKAPRESVGWLRWFPKTEIPSNDSKAPLISGPEGDRKGETSKERPRSNIIDAPQDAEAASPEPRRNSDPSPISPKAQEEPPSRSWLGLWGNTTKVSQKTDSAGATGPTTTGSAKPNGSPIQSKQPGSSDPDPISTPQPPPQPADAGKSYGWAFWSKDQSKDDKGRNGVGEDVGELAQAGSASGSRPEDAIVDKKRGVPDKVEKRQRPQSLETAEDNKKAKRSGESSNLDTIDSVPSVASKRDSVAGTSSKAKQTQENLLLPPFKRTYNIAGKPSLIQQLGSLLQLSSTPQPKHVSISQSPHRVRRALAIGVHGYFPAPLIRSVLGQPTGTSIRFANGAANAIQEWTQAQGYSCEIEKVALEGEGKIAERTDLLWKLLLNWIEKIQQADFVMIACHSQGVPVALMLVAKLIAFGCLNSAKIGVCAMAGVNLGPFGDYKSRWISGSAGELFDFAQPESQVSKDYEAALDVCLRFGVKIIYVGSIDDQLVSLESSTFATISHPYIYRAVFIDGRIHAPDFLTHLVGFVLKLRNLGISDHGLIRELSTPLAGSLYTGEGHSRIYDDEAVYYLAVEHALETTDLGPIPLQTHRDNPTSSNNPYILPFAMRGLLEEDYVRTELYGEVTELIKQFDDWKPSSKVLKDVKFRLEGVRSRL